MTTNERLTEQSFCYDPDFPPDVAEGLPLSAAAPEKRHSPAHGESLRRALRAASSKASSLARRDR